MSKYGEKFDKRLEKTLKCSKGRTIWDFIISGYFGCYGIIEFINVGEVISLSLILIGGMCALIGMPMFCVSFYRYVTYLRPYTNVLNRVLKIAEYLGQDGKTLKAEFKKRRKNKERNWIIQTTDYYYDECERLKAEYGQNPPKEEIENEGKGGFDGWLLQKLGWILLGALVTICTAGICFPVAYIWVLRWQYKHSLYDGRRLSFDGKVSQLLGKWVCWLLLCIPTVGIYILFIPKKLLQWKASHLHHAGGLPFLGSTWRGNAIVLLLVQFGCFLFTLITLWLLKPLSICWKNRYIQKRLVIDGRKIQFDGNGVQILGKWILWTLLTLITFGIYALFRNLRIYRWVNKHTHIKGGYQQITVL